MVMSYVSKHLPFHQVNPSHEQGAHPAGHVHCIEQEVADGLVLFKAITASSMQSASCKDTEDQKLYNTANKKGIDFFSDKRSTGILGPTAVQ
jgi:hypothetical protein